jgi:hypothetical protein
MPWRRWAVACGPAVARVRAAIMTGQVAIASILLIASVLLCRSFSRDAAR